MSGAHVVAQAESSSASEAEYGKKAPKGGDGSAPYLPKLPREVADGWAAQTEAKKDKKGLIARLRRK